MVPEPTTIHTAKKIIQRLAKEKGRKKKFLHRESDENFMDSSRNYVYNWLKRNSFIEEDELTFFKSDQFDREDIVLLEDLEDINQIKNVNIYDYFKLYDYGVQFSPQTQNLACQSEELVQKDVEVMAMTVKKVDNYCQTVRKIETKTNIS